VPKNEDMLADKLYINKGNGHFEKKAKFMTQQYESKSCITVADVDHDGDMDAFVGTLTTPTIYGKMQSSYLLLNDGSANFTIANSKNAFFYDIGMVTAASFTDLNNDGWKDLIVTGEFMPIKIFINSKGSFKPSEIPNSTGLWQAIYTSDVNGDGFTDILAGNWGHNNKLWSGKNGPVKLYVKDFDKNGSVEQVMCYTVDGSEYTFLAKDELERSIPVLKKAYLKYSEVAGKDVKYMFYDLFNGYLELKAETLSSSCFISDGKGKFVQMQLPDELQVSPIFSFSQVLGNKGSLCLAGGNFYGVIPYEGRYDALLATAFSYDNKKNAFHQSFKIPSARGEVRDMKWLSSVGGKRILVVANNNSALQYFKLLN